MKKMFLTMFLACTVLLSSCGASSSKNTDESSPMSFTGGDYGDINPSTNMDGNSNKSLAPTEGAIEQFAINDDIAMEESGNDNVPTVSSNSDRKIITNIRYSLETKNYSETITNLQTKIDETNSFIQHSSTYGDEENGDAGAQFTIRVPTDKLDDFKSSVDTLGNITHTSESGEDVTKEYFDTESRLEILTAQEKTILKLLDKAVNIEEIMLIETELSKIRTQIEQLTTVVKRLDDLVSYATINIDISQASDYSVAKPTFMSQVSQVFVNSFNGFVNVLGICFAGLIFALPYLIIVTILIFVLIGIRKRKKNTANIAVQQSERD